MKLEILVRQLEKNRLVLNKQGSFDNIDIHHLAFDSRMVGPKGLFVAVFGDKVDGHLFIDKAVQNGAITIVCEAMPEHVRKQYPGIAFVHVTNTRAALAELCTSFYGHPSSKLKMVGVTGTNGKTTISFLVHHVLTVLGERTGLLGTIEYRFGGEPVVASHTTPDALVINQMLDKMVKASCSSCVMEVSSHALDQDRVRGIQYDVALLTNLTRDHLDYHGSFQRYLEAKKKLFDDLPTSATALYNIDDTLGQKAVVDTRANIIAYGQSKEADLHLEVLDNEISGLRLRIDGIERKYKLIGLFNAYNLLAAYGVACALGYCPAEVIEALATAKSVPGRFEILRDRNGTTVIVDYAHTPDALENVLLTIRGTKQEHSAIWCVFGCGGDRDKVKRRIMGTIAEKYADHVIVTSDNPRTEDPESIMNDIRMGMDDPSAASWIVDRRGAIEKAAQAAAAGDVVLIAGKGHETYQVIGTEKYPFNDRDEVLKSFSALS